MITAMVIPDPITAPRGIAEPGSVETQQKQKFYMNPVSPGSGIYTGLQTPDD